MSKTDARRARINDKIAASQARLQRDAEPTEIARPLRDAYPPEHVSTLAGQYPLLTLAAGALAGVALGALLPRTFGRKFSRRAVTIITIAGELGLAASRRARDSAAEAGRHGTARLGELGDSIGEGSGELRRTAGRVAGSVVGGARSTGMVLAREAIKLAARARR